MILSSKAKRQELKLIDKLDISKTKDANKILNNLKIDKSVLIAKENKAFRNISKVKTIAPQNLNVLDLLNYKYLLVPSNAMQIIEKTWK